MRRRTRRGAAHVRIALYTGLRPGELRALTWEDVDLDARVLHISKAIDAETEETKTTKTAEGVRTVPIHANRLPLLDAMKGARTALVLPELAGNVRRIAERFRAHLTAAGVTRPRLSADTDSEEPVDFRSLRDSYATWSAIAGVDAKRLKRRMGHRKEDTTDRYIKAAESFDVEGVGEPFPLLPDSLWPHGRSETNLSIENLSSPTLPHVRTGSPRSLRSFPAEKNACKTATSACRGLFWTSRLWRSSGAFWIPERSETGRAWPSATG